MTALEIRATWSLASLFALRMLGLFLILPVFSAHAPSLSGGTNLTLVGLALGIYGLTQGILQIPFGMASDRFGRKRTIVVGLVIFAVGSFVAASATDIWTAIFGRALQGAGAISAAVVAFLADLTRDEHRTKAMAVIGGSIGLMFALSLAGAPALYSVIGMSGIFALTGILSLAAILMTLYMVPKEAAHRVDSTRPARMALLVDILRGKELVRLNVGIFALHAMQMSLFVVIPLALTEHGGMPVADHWKVYLPVVLISFVLMVPPLMAAERRGRTKAIFIGAIVALVVVQIAFLLGGDRLWVLFAGLLLFFVAFNILEASMPSLVTKIASVAARGTAIGVYNTTQAIGLFVGGAAGGALAHAYGAAAVFLFGLVATAIWLVVALPMRPPSRTIPPTGSQRQA
ncbi:MAG: MFS transporter [Betaproteobacteria bacterium]|nr:MFS transporter [Betaproteobacteria bacterium]